MIFKNNLYRTNLGWGIRIYRCQYPYKNPTLKFEALLIKLGRRGLWLFRNKRTLQEWPSTN